MTPEDLQKLLPELRALRLWHWQSVGVYRNAENVYKVIGASSNWPELAKNKADFHLKQVQLLNSFFEIGDTAEQDSQR